MKLLILADLHYVDYYEWQKFLKIDKSSFDAILLLGDIDIMFLKSLKGNFPNDIMLGVLGNHDNFGDLEYFDIINIHGRTLDMGNLSIVGVEGCLKYKQENAPLHSQEEISNMLDKISAKDILMSHNSPYGVHDKEDLAHSGYIGVSEYIKNNKPKCCIHGHQHKNIITEYEGVMVIGVYGGVILDVDTMDIEYVLNIE